MLVLSSLLLLTVVGSAAAQDETMPVVVVPEDIPGADVIVIVDGTYEFDLSGSSDDVGIVNFLIEFVDGGIPISINDADGVYDYTFSNYGQIWIKVQAFDAAGNIGMGVFTIDVAELITSDVVYRDGGYAIDHSLYLDDVDFVMQNAQLSMTEGAGTTPYGGGAGEIITEGITITAGMPGVWTSGYPYNFIADPNDKIAGDYSIRGYYPYYYSHYMQYLFDGSVDLTSYEGFRFFTKSNYYYYNHFDSIYFYDSSGRYARFNQYWYYNYVRYYPDDWLDITASFDRSETYWSYVYPGFDWTSCTRLRINFYNYYYTYASYYIWVDGFTFLTEPMGDHISEGQYNRNGDPWDGYWSGFSTNTNSNYVMAGDNSLYSYMSSSYNYKYYYFDNPMDFTQYSGAHFFTRCTSPSYSSYVRQFYLWDASGNYAYTYSSYGTNGLYNARYGWTSNSFPTNKGNFYSYSYYFDWTSVARMRITFYGRPYGTYVDGFEFTSPSSGGPTVSDYLPNSIYIDGGNMSITNDSTIYGAGDQGSRIMFDGGTATINGATFDNMWWTQYPGADATGGSFGGLEIYGDAVISNAAFTNSGGVGLALFDGTWTCDQDTIDLSGSTLEAEGAPMIIFGVTDRTTGAVSFDITGWRCEDSPGGTGIMLAVGDTTASIDVTIWNNSVDNNAFAGIIIANSGGGAFSQLVQGTTADLDVVIRDQVIEDSGSYGIVYYAGMGAYDPNIMAHLTIENVTVRSSGEHGIVTWLDVGATNLDAYIANSTVEKNVGNGIANLFSGFFGEATYDFFNLTIADNDGNGIEFYSDMKTWDDGNGNIISPVSNINVTIHSCLIKSNDGYGLAEHHNAVEAPEGGVAPPWTWNGPTRTTLNWNMEINTTDILENSEGGWVSYPDEGWSHADLNAERVMVTSSIDSNRGPALYVEANHDLWGGGGKISDVYKIVSSRIIDNTAGVVVWFGYDNYGYYSEIHLLDTRIEGQDEDAILIQGPISGDGILTWGVSRILGAMVYVDGCRINGPVEFSMMGADDQGGPDWQAKMGIQFTNNVFDLEDENIEYHIGAYPNCRDFLAWVEIGENRFFRGRTGNGIDLDMFGGWNLEMDLTIRDANIDSVSGSGLDIEVGTLVNSIEPHQIFGTVMIDNVTITDAGSNGLNFTVAHKQFVGAKSRGVLEMRDTTVSGAVNGIMASHVSGIIYDSTLSGISGEGVNIQYSVFDFFSCNIGPVTTENIKVFTKGAARMWFDVAVDVHWASGDRVSGAVVSVQDNTWSTIGVDTVEAGDVVPFGYVNSYTVLPESVYSRSPYLVGATFLGLETEEMVDIDGNMVIDLILVDDVLPKLTVNMPIDGGQQRETTLKVRGYAWDMHSGLDTVQVSIDDGFTWYDAIGAPDFTYTFDNVPEGQIILIVKAVDNAGNERTEYIAILVDATAPVIIIIEPTLDIFITQDRTLRVIGVTEMGAMVTVDNDPVTMDLTIFHATVMLREGMNEVRVVARDAMGNAAVHIITVELDTIAPPLIITGPGDGTTIGKRTVMVVGQTEPGARVMVNGEQVANIDGQFSIKTSLFEGPNAIVVTAEDTVGNVGTGRVTVLVDTIEPWLELVSPMNGDVYGIGGIHVEGWVEGGSIVLVNDRPFDVTDGHFSGTIMGSEGDFPVTITVVDEAGNAMSRTVSVMMDTNAPTIELEAPADGTMTSEETIEIEGKITWDAREEFRDVSLMMNGNFAPFAATGDFKVKYELVEGTNPIIITAEDDVGNSVTMAITVFRDSKAPFLLAEATPTFDHPVWNKPATYRNLVFIEGVTEPGATVTVDGAEVTVGQDGTFNVSVQLDPVPEGDNLVHRNILVMSTDAAGNSRDETIDVYRLKEEETTTGFFEYDSSQYWVLVLSLIILVGAIVAAAMLLRRIGRSPEEEEYGDDMYDGGM